MVQSKWFWRGIAAILVLASAGLHLAFLARNCPLDLAPDEALYWQWSQKLDASYYSKGPLVAYLIRAACSLAGQRSIALCGNEGLAVRLPAVVCGSLTLVALYVLAVQCFGAERLGAAIVACALSLPALAVNRSIMTIDAPYACCWAWALVLGHQAIFRKTVGADSYSADDRHRWVGVLCHSSVWAWIGLGLTIGLGILAKYTMVLWLPSAALFLLWSKEHRRLLWQPGPWITCAIAGACCLPILWWNWRNGWVALRHVWGQAGMAGAKPPIIWTGPLKYVGGQASVLFGFWFIVWVLAMWRHRPTREADPHRFYLWFLSVPQFLFFGLFSFKTDVLLNWPMTAYFSGLVLGSVWFAERVREVRQSRRPRWLASACATAAVGLTTTLVLHDTHLIRPLLAKMAGPSKFADDMPIRRFDPSCRMRGWRFLSAQVDLIRKQVEDGKPILAASRWTIASELAFYCEGHPTTYSLGSALWDRQSEYDLWRPNPICDPASFEGKAFVFVDVGIVPNEIRDAFERIEPTKRIWYFEDGIPVAFWDITVCQGFRGFPKLPEKRF